MHLPLEAFTKFTFYNGIQFDFDSIAQPSQAWRRKLNNHASKLKEFRVTFREAIKMALLGIRLWSYVREEASYGRRTLIDLFTQKRCKPSAFQGVPLGGIGLGQLPNSQVINMGCMEIDEDSDTDSGGEMVHGILTSGTKSHK
ncbi:hypothetical protein CQW23_14461 [Capsicum baccatum]|uniref:Uncharacterized protein n=1 Tax=Capsicum baccatum TaxID=33114 RepID=A0A2G2WJ83_CAPBA|nr:hypothetical protein CQW23_14461 [Capsicum baccatum]